MPLVQLASIGLLLSLGFDGLSVSGAQVALEKVSLPPSSLRSLVSGLVGNREGAVRELCLEDSWLTDQHVR